MESATLITHWTLDLGAVVRAGFLMRSHCRPASQLVALTRETQNPLGWFLDAEASAIICGTSLVGRDLRSGAGLFGRPPSSGASLPGEDARLLAVKEILSKVSSPYVCLRLAIASRRACRL